MNAKLQITDLKLQRFQRALEQHLERELEGMNERILDHVFNQKREIAPNDKALHNYIMNRSAQSPLEKSFRDFLHGRA